MKKQIIALIVGFITFANVAKAQQWNGNNGTTESISRTGFVKIGGDPNSLSMPLNPLEVNASNAPLSLNPESQYAVRVLNTNPLSSGLYVQSATTADNAPVLSVTTRSTGLSPIAVPLATFYANGKIGFGTTFSSSTLPSDFDSYRLYVLGGIRTERLKLDIASAKGWADFVFDKDYRLMPLTELQKYILEHKHLPNVPSAEELVKQGLDVSEMQKIQMQKIEELTLYLLEQQKQIAALKERIIELEKK